MFPLNMDNFRWGKEPDSPYKQFARELWTKAFDFSKERCNIGQLVDHINKKHRRKRMGNTETYTATVKV